MNSVDHAKADPAQSTPAPGRDSPDGARPIARILGDGAAAVWGMSGAERLRRSFARAGVEARAEDCGPTRPQSRPRSVVLARGDYVFEERLIRGLVARPGVILTIERQRSGGEPARVPVAAHVETSRAEPIAALLRRGAFDPGTRDIAGLAVLGPGEVGSAYDKALRKRGLPYVFSLEDEPAAEIERRMFQGAYKGVTDFITKWLWPVPALAVTRWAAKRGITPNLVTALSLVLVFLAMWLFAAGYQLAGLAAAWLMTFLDTVDGKLARVTLTSTPAGNVFDHGIDLIHPPFWYAAWWYGLSAAAAGGTLAPWHAAALWVVVGGYVLGRLMEGLFLWLFRLEIHAWRPVDSYFRLFTARRNPNLALLTIGALAGRPDLGFLAVAVWTIVSLLFHGVRLCQALGRSRRAGPIRSWLSEPLASPSP